MRSGHNDRRNRTRFGGLQYGPSLYSFDCQSQVSWPCPWPILFSSGREGNEHSALTMSLWGVQPMRMTSYVLLLFFRLSPERTECPQRSGVRLNHPRRVSTMSKHGCCPTGTKRILSNGSQIGEVLRNVLFKSGRATDGQGLATLIDSLRYLRRGPDMMWERCRAPLADSGLKTRYRDLDRAYSPCSGSGQRGRGPQRSWRETGVERDIFYIQSAVTRTG